MRALDLKSSKTSETIVDYDWNIHETLGETIAPALTYVLKDPACAIKD